MIPHKSPSPGVYFAFASVTIAAVAIFASIFLGVSPRGASKAMYWLFFVSMFVAMSGVLGLVWYGVRRLFFIRRFLAPSFLISLRQAVLLAAVITLSLFLNSVKLFQIWDVLPLILAAVLIEFFFQAEKRPHASLSPQAHDS